MTQLLTIGKLVKEVGIGIETIRFYERAGLLTQPIRTTGSGYRKYSMLHVQCLMFIAMARELGFSLEEIKELFALKVKTKSQCATVKAKSEHKLAAIDEKIEGLMGIKIALQSLVSSCDSDAPISECVILDLLTQQVIGA